MEGFERSNVAVRAAKSTGKVTAFPRKWSSRRVTSRDQAPVVLRCQCMAMSRDVAWEKAWLDQAPARVRGRIEERPLQIFDLSVLQNCPTSR